MSCQGERGARRLYRLLLLAYSRDHREAFGEEMEESFMALLRRDGRRAGPWGRITCWMGAAIDAGLRGTATRVAAAFGTTGRRGEGMGTFLTDIRIALRSLGRRPVFFATVAMTLALGIGANAAVFTVVNGLLLTPLPYEAPKRLVVLWDENPELGWRNTDVSPANAWDWRARSRTLADIAVFYGDEFNMTGDGPPELVTAVRVTPNILGLLGRTPILGRDFAPDEVGEGQHRVTILMHGFWTRRFGGDPDVLGRTIDLDGDPHTVVGVMAADFMLLEERPDVLVPQDVHPALAERSGHYAEAVARMADGVSVDEAGAELRSIAAELEAEFPEDNDGWTVRVVSAHEDLLGPVARQASLVLMVAVGLVLLMACVNVANLLLARGGVRTRELAVRAALGAARRRVVGLLVTENLVLGVVGGTLGLLLGFVGYRAIVAALPSQIPPVFRFEMDVTVVLFVAGLTLGTVALFGLAPAFRTATDAAAALRDGGRAGPSRRVGRFGATLVVLQTAMAVVLLVGGGLLMKSVAGMRSQDFGFDPEGVVTMRLAPPSTAYPGASDLRAFWDAVEDRVRMVPGVVAVGTTQSHPLMGSNWGNTVRIAGREEGPDAERTVRTTYASPGLFEALRFRVVRGRGITDEDHADAPPVVVVNETFVSRYLGEDVDPLTQSISGAADGMPDIPIVGVLQDALERSVDDAPEPSWYVPMSHSATRTRSLVVRTDGPPEEAIPLIQEAIWSIDATLPVFQVETMEALIERRVGSYAVIAELMAAFAFLSLLLGAVGIYGVTAHATAQRRGEIGVRMALGAQRGHVVRMVLIAGAGRVVLGLALGLAAAFGLAGLLGSVLVGVEPRDPVVFGVVVLVLANVSFLGLYLPARRASRVDPVQALALD
jgi:putative ABC transport system permease protein